MHRGLRTIFAPSKARAATLARPPADASTAAWKGTKLSPPRAHPKLASRSVLRNSKTHKIWTHATWWLLDNGQ
ncbi:hypothetical protein WJX74_004943 [Apatococcus lobatus]|uniref:Uncharacterized protein n=1 Tax=Apatococcus lobatus TaxID=904363 RepID=A0AAW1QLM4_9CHLO